MKKIILITIGLISLNSFSFPELIRHGYTNCTACHVSPSGGGVLNEYGKSLSNEVLSSWAYKGEENFLHGAVDTSKVKDWLVIGGDLRGVQLHEEMDDFIHGEFIKMQAGVELGVNLEKWAFVTFIGKFISEDEWKAYSNKYYILYRATDELSIHAGRFLPNYGLNIAEHIMSTRGPMGFGYGMERDGAEVSWLGEGWNFTGTYYKAPKDISTENQIGYVATASKIFSESYKVGLQYLTQNDDTKMKVQSVGANALLGWNKKLYTLAEVDQVTFDMSGTTSKGVFAFHKTGYEFFKGFHGLLLNDYMQTDIKDGTTKEYKYGPGIQWFPRPHFDFQLFWTKMQSQEALNKDGDFAWLVFHYYL